MDKLPKQETIKEVAERMYPINNTGSMFMANREELNNSLKQEGFIEGYNHAVKTLYTDEDMIEASKYGYNFHKTSQFPNQEFEDSCIRNTQQWMTKFNQNKKK